VYIADDVVRAAIVGDSLQLVAQARTAVGVPMPEVAVAWTSNEPTKASVTATGLVRFHAAGVTELVATARDKSRIVRVAGLEPLAGEWSNVHDWSTLQGDNRRSGHQPVTVDPRSITFSWGLGLGFATGHPVTDGDVIYVNAGDAIGSSLRALNAETGALIWLRRFGPDSGTFSPTFADDKLYAQAPGNPSGRLHLIDALTGADIVAPTSYEDQWVSYFAPLAAGGKIYTGGGRYSGLYAYDGLTGALDWTAEAPQVYEWGPSLWNDELLYYLSDGVRVFDRATGAPLRLVPDPHFIPFGAPSAIAVSPEGLAAVIRWQRIAGFDLVSNTRTWQHAAAYRGHPAIANGRVFAWNAGTLEARDAVTGAPLWNFPLESGFGAAVAATDNLIFATSPGRVYALDAASGLLVWTGAAGGSLGIGDGVLIVGGPAGGLTVYTLK
jgi:outer membrane protein assembly factor BamB